MSTTTQRMKNKILIIGGACILILVIIFGLFIFSSNSDDSDVLGIAESASTSEQEQVWVDTVSSYNQAESNFEAYGVITGVATQLPIDVEFQMDYTLLLDNENAEMRLYSENHEAFITVFDNKAYIADNTKNPWYAIESEVLEANDGNFDVESFSNLANLWGQLLQIEPDYTGSFNCGGEVCLRYEFEINDRKAVLLIEENTNIIDSIEISNPNSTIVMQLRETNEIVQEPNASEQLTTENAQQIIQDIISPIVLDNFSLFDVLGF